jgi:hypothetical protein
MAEENQLLEIARQLNQKTPIPTILKNLRVSGHHIAKVTDMIKNGLIVFNPDGEPRFTVPYTKIRAISTGKYRKRTLDPEELSRLTVVETHQEALAEEARNQTDAYLVLGRSIFQAFTAWAVKHGYTLEDIRNMPIHKIIIEALDKADELDRIKPEYEQLKAEVEYLKAKLDPLIRLKEVATKLPETILHLDFLDELGINIDPITKIINEALTRYIVGEASGGEKT